METCDWHYFYFYNDRNNTISFPTSILKASVLAYEQTPKNSYLSVRDCWSEIDTDTPAEALAVNAPMLLFEVIVPNSFSRTLVPS